MDLLVPNLKFYYKEQTFKDMLDHKGEMRFSEIISIKQEIIVLYIFMRRKQSKVILRSSNIIF